MVRDQSPATTPGSAPPDVPRSLSWAVTPETNRWLHLLSYGLLAPLGALALVLFSGAVAFVAVSVREGAWAVVLALGAVAVVALARPPVLAALWSDETDASLGHEEWHPSRRGVLASAVLCGGAVLLASQHSRAAAGAVVALSFVTGLVAMTLGTDAEIDGEEMRLSVDAGSAVALDSLSGVRSVAVGSVVIYWLAYARGAGSLWAPRVLTVPREQAKQVRELLDAGVDADTDATPIGRTERAVVALVGIGALAVAPTLWLLAEPREGSGLVFTYLGVFSLVVAVPALWHAWRA